MPLRLYCPALASLLILLAVLVSPIASAKPAEIEQERLQPGLLAVYRSGVDPNATLARVEPKPAFSLGLSSPHPRLPPGPFEVVWTGVLLLRDAEPISFDARICGHLTVQVDGVTVLEGMGKQPSDRLVSRKPLVREPGPYRLTIHFKSSPGLPARVQIGWQSATFPWQPIPAWQFKHIPAELPRAAAQDERETRGRLLVSRFGCARCHGSAFPGVKDPPPGPSLADVRKRLRPAWLLAWLADPAQVRPDAHMPAVFPSGRQGFVERWLVMEHLVGAPPTKRPPVTVAPGNHRVGRTAFIHLGCAACHFLPDLPVAEQADLGRWPLTGLADRLPPDSLATFLRDPRCRYPDGRMPRFAMSLTTAQDIAAYLLLWSTPLSEKLPAPPSSAEVTAVLHRLKVSTRTAAARALLQNRGCVQCHPGLEPARTVDIRLPSKAATTRGCLSATGLPRFAMNGSTRRDLAAYLAVASSEKYPSPFTERQHLLKRAGCVRCHQRDTDRPPALEQAGSTLGGSLLETVPYQRTPRLTQPHQKYRVPYLLQVVRDGAHGLKGPRYSYQMPAFGPDAAILIKALAEADGNVPLPPEPADRPAADPTLGSLMGSTLAGFQGYACVACHVWAGRYLADPDPGAVGPDLTRVAGRIRRDWFNRFLQDPSGFCPGTPMPAVFPRGGHTTVRSILNGDPVRQKQALWSYFALGSKAPSPQPPPPLPIATPANGEPPLVAQIPIRLPDSTVVESITVLDSNHDLLVYDLAGPGLRAIYTGAEILRHAQGRQRWYAIAGQPLHENLTARPVLQLTGRGKPVPLSASVLHGYDRLTDGVRLRWQARFGSIHIEVIEPLRLVPHKQSRRLVRELQLTGIPAGHAVEWHGHLPKNAVIEVQAMRGTAKSRRAGDTLALVLTPSTGSREATVSITEELPASRTPPVHKWTVPVEPDHPEGSLQQPGYRVIAYPRPKTVAGDDRIMPAALAIHPRTGKVFVASWKTGELFVLDDPTDDGKSAQFRNYTHGLFQDCLAMHADDDGLYVLHRRNLTRVLDTTGRGVADRFERVFALPHGVADTYDYAYGLVRDRAGAFVLSFAPYANTSLPGSGGALRWKPGQTPTEIAFGFRNPLGWCTGPDGEVFFTDNQGEWVATNKLCHLEPGRFYGFPNPAQKQHASRPRGGTAIWIPYGWAHSINGVAYDNTGGKFGPFQGQFFLAELMFGGAIIRAQVEKVNGQYQGACFPFWGRGLLGPLTLAFDPRGRLFVGSLTEPGWMAQPDRGGLFRIDFTGQTPFEMQAIHVRPQGFRIHFTKPVATETARRLTSYHLEHYRYEYTGAYGSPELDRTPVAVERVELSADGRTVELMTSPLVKGRVYLLRLPGIRSAKGEPLVHAEAAYTLNEVPPR